MTESIVIVGAGVGGLTAGVALEQAGFEVEILERAEQLRTEGAGISMFQNALRCLDRLGVAEQVVAAGDRFDAGGLYTSDGTPLLEGLTQTETASDLPIGIGLHRGQLVEILDDHLTASVEFGAEVVDVDPDGSDASVTVDGGSERRGDLVIGCDGLHSVVRKWLLPPAANELRYAGYTSWRGLAEWPYEEPSEVNPGEYWGAGRRFGMVPIGDDRVYWFAVQNAEPDQSRTGSTRWYLCDEFGAWAEPIYGLIEATSEDSIIQADIYDRDPVDIWGRGRATLLGDAAHPMTPDLGQGGCQAVEDAVVLADALSEHRDRPVNGLRAYEGRRQPRTRELVERARRMGRMAQVSNPVLVMLRNLSFRLMPQWLIEKQYTSTLEPEFLA